MAMTKIKHPAPTDNPSFKSEFVSSLKRKDPALKTHKAYFETQANMPWNIYHPGKPLAEHMKKFSGFHYFVKYRIAVPALLVVERLIRKHLEKDVPDEVYNRELKIFNDAWEKSIEDWNAYFLCINNPDFAEHPKAIMELARTQGSKNGWSNRNLRTIKGLLVTLALNDTAYREFLNIYMHNQAQMMNEFHRGKKEYHLFYSDKDIWDVTYLIMWKQIENGELNCIIESLQDIERTGLTNRPRKKDGVDVPGMKIKFNPVTDKVQDTKKRVRR